MNRLMIVKITNEILSRKFEDLNDNERREYLREHNESRWVPGKSRMPKRKKKKR